MANTSQSCYANGTIPCSTIVVGDSSHNNAVVKATSNTVIPVGVAGNAARNRPDPDFSQSTQAQQIAAIAGESVPVWGAGSIGVDVVCNEAWSAGAYIMADASGFGVVATTGKYYVGRAQTAGTVGALCPIDVNPGYYA